MSRMAKILKRRGNNIEAGRRGAGRNGHLGDVFSKPGQGRERVSLSLMVAFLNDTTQQHNTHITDVREICYSWHPWHGRAVRVHANLVKRGRSIAYCSLEDVPTCRVLEVPLWMLDVATCCKTRLSQPGFASVQSLRELKDVLQSPPARIRDQLGRKHSIDTC
jgi:hypothetical protein